MLRIRMLSGAVLTSIAVEEVQDARSVKLHLHQMHGCPPRFRQRLFLHGEMLEDHVRLDNSMDLDLVLLTFVESSQERVDDLGSAAGDGRQPEVRNPETAHTHSRRPMPSVWVGVKLRSF